MVFGARSEAEQKGSVLGCRPTARSQIIPHATAIQKYAFAKLALEFLLSGAKSAVAACHSGVRGEGGQSFGSAFKSSAAFS